MALKGAKTKIDEMQEALGAIGDFLKLLTPVGAGQKELLHYSHQNVERLFKSTAKLSSLLDSYAGEGL